MRSRATLALGAHRGGRHSGGGPARRPASAGRRRTRRSPVSRSTSRTCGSITPASTAPPSRSRATGRASPSSPGPAPTSPSCWCASAATSRPRTLAGTEGADAPFFSPDGQWIGYVVANKLFKIPAAGGAPVQLADDVSLAVGGGTWLDDGRVVYTASGYAFKAVPSKGGAATVIVPAPTAGAAHYPAAVPGKDVLLATRCGNTCAGPVLVAIDLKSGTMDTILTGSRARILSPERHRARRAVGRQRGGRSLRRRDPAVHQRADAAADRRPARARHHSRVRHGRRRHPGLPAGELGRHGDPGPGGPHRAGAGCSIRPGAGASSA